MVKRDGYKLALSETIDSSDSLNSQFYGRFPYPWSPSKFDLLDDPYFYTIMLNQDIGDYDHATLSGRFKIWVAGCGTNQALFTALKFPNASVLGSDISTGSLSICAANAESLGVSNLTLRAESLNTVTYRDEFDYLISTGVIHHNADPVATLEKLAGALKPDGIMELMVYNRFHWIIPDAFHRGVKILTGQSGKVDFECELDIAKRMINALPTENSLSRYLSDYRSCPESMFADELLQPIIHSYTVELLEQMAASCGLELILPCVNQFDKATGSLCWNIKFNDPAIQEIYDSLPDLRRWQVSNMFLLENSPLLWFYLQRKDSRRQIKSERQVCEDFLSRKFIRNYTTQGSYLLRGEGAYELSRKSTPFPPHPTDEAMTRVIDFCDGKTTMREILDRLEIPTDFHTVNLIRIKLTVSTFPHLRSVNVEPVAGDTDGALKRERDQSNLKKFKSVKPKIIKAVEQDN